ncbi:unnamed protein product [Cyprideis torosa]|uniref:Uncharacterized protein n=1 Tax=Cyprideis torosa TaxID=163714 RepID=A0A7R8ZRB9_9CRUS|nr:unnamed protein product [Cyprideis torosa]CAG0904779.1 unnamed protein product [Cyprideis torosa]
MEDPRARVPSSPRVPFQQTAIGSIGYRTIGNRLPATAENPHASTNPEDQSMGSIQMTNYTGISLEQARHLLQALNLIRGYQGLFEMVRKFLLHPLENGRHPVERLPMLLYRTRLQAGETVSYLVESLQLSCESMNAYGSYNIGYLVEIAEKLNMLRNIQALQPQINLPPSHMPFPTSLTNPERQQRTLSQTSQEIKIEEAQAGQETLLEGLLLERVAIQDGHLQRRYGGINCLEISFPSFSLLPDHCPKLRLLMALMPDLHPELRLLTALMPGHYPKLRLLMALMPGHYPKLRLLMALMPDLHPKLLLLMALMPDLHPKLRLLMALMPDLHPKLRLLMALMPDLHPELRLLMALMSGHYPELRLFMASKHEVRDEGRPGDHIHIFSGNEKLDFLSR